MFKAKLSAALLVALAAGSANAANYLSLQYLNSTEEAAETGCTEAKDFADEWGFTAVCQKNDDGFRGAFGFDLNANFALEIGYADLGDFYSGVEFTANDYTRVGSNLEGFDLTAITRVPIANQFNFVTRVGVFAWEQKIWVESTVQNSTSISEEGESWYFGAGFEFSGVSVGYELLRNVGAEDRMRESDIERYTLGARIDF